MNILDLILMSAIDDALNDVLKNKSFEESVRKEAEKSKKSAVKQHIDEEQLRKKNDLIKNSKIFYRGNETALVHNGKVYKSVVESGEKYDKEKGVMSCLLKALGVSTTDIINLMKK